MWIFHATSKCLVCRKPLKLGKRPTAVTCSGACRQALYRFHDRRRVTRLTAKSAMV
jgi:predicted nucleic acid-binding Zn ribbon protein